MNENYYHQHQDVRKEGDIQFGDLTAFIDIAYAKKIAGINLSTLASLALAPGVPTNTVIDVRELENGTTLKWEKPANGNAAYYYVLMRETYQPLWQTKFKTEDNQITLPYSKDNYFFGVQSVDKDGHESLVDFPCSAPQLTAIRVAETRWVFLY